MKKMLILLLVMGVASTANATISLVSSAGPTLDPTGTINPDITMIQIYNDTAEPGVGQIWYAVLSAADPGNWTGVSNVHQPPSFGGTNTYYGEIDFGTGLGTTDTWKVDLLQATPDPYGVGVLADLEFLCTGEGDVTITLIASDLSTIVDRMTIEQVIPEPITFALLGLGGLFLRRRK